MVNVAVCEMLEKKYSSYVNCLHTACFRSSDREILKRTERCTCEACRVCLRLLPSTSEQSGLPCQNSDTLILFHFISPYCLFVFNLILYFLS
jgi:hypothetical protein